jgi:hypothetical protein
VTGPHSPGPCNHPELEEQEGAFHTALRECGFATPRLQLVASRFWSSVTVALRGKCRSQVNRRLSPTASFSCLVARSLEGVGSAPRTAKRNLSLAAVGDWAPSSHQHGGSRNVVSETFGKMSILLFFLVRSHSIRGCVSSNGKVAPHRPTVLHTTTRDLRQNAKERSMATRGKHRQAETRSHH